jgi:hypothetical protein
MKTLFEHAGGDEALHWVEEILSSKVLANAHVRNRGHEGT